MNPMADKFGQLYKGTNAELALEPAVASLGQVYRTNFPCYLFAGGLRYFIDVAFPVLKVGFEIDDKSHRRKKAEDAARTAEIQRVYGWRIVRCTNEEAEADPAGTVNRLMEELDLPYRTPTNLVLPSTRWLPPLKEK